jgi:hypothetical protein
MEVFVSAKQELGETLSAFEFWDVPFLVISELKLRDPLTSSSIETQIWIQNE